MRYRFRPKRLRLAQGSSRTAFPTNRGLDTSSTTNSATSARENVGKNDLADLVLRPRPLGRCRLTCKARRGEFPLG